ncbi:hypothetical protein AGLY_017531 [Aphis glycines]|uniref:Uncharacterized protein n=1 Tax=Aphis glycines TaxID=307491 RepID=A0A6G0SWJ5_APHGL|nr:hypothetical protein AGLY_017531 [Aphis glycines]
MHGRSPILDQRGLKNGGLNKISEEKLKTIKYQINKIPKYTSHYCREQSNFQNLPPEMTITLKKDTCNTCDSLKVQINNEQNAMKKEELNIKHTEHLSLAENAQTSLKIDLRQLWLYNTGIFSGKDNQGYCYVWLEGKARRGAQEVDLVLWSDSCGGQNRNIKIVLLIKTLFNNTELETITLKYLYPGHSFLSQH